MHGDTSLRAQCISDRIPYRLDTKISPPHPESWRQGVCSETFSEGFGDDARMRDCRTEYQGGPFASGDGNSPKICSQ